MSNEKELITLALNGDESAFKTLLEANLPKLTNLLQTQYRLDPQDLNDIVQTATVKAWQKLASFRCESSFLTWLFIILRNETLDFKKKRNNIDKFELPAHFSLEELKDGDYEHILHSSLDDKLSETAHSLMERRETLDTYRKVIAEVLNKLKPSHSQIIKMVLEDNKTYQEIADELGIPIGTVMSRLFFARKNAQKLIQQYATRNELQLACLGRRKQHSVSRGNQAGHSKHKMVRT
jgi:RNA polymerase sigma factor (sigma-70 family)